MVNKTKAEINRQMAELKKQLDAIDQQEQQEQQRLEALAKDEALARTKVAERVYDLLGVEPEHTQRRQVGRSMSDVSTDKNGALRAERALAVLEAVAKSGVLKDNQEIAKAITEQEAKRNDRKRERDEAAAKKRKKDKPEEQPKDDGTDESTPPTVPNQPQQQEAPPKPGNDTQLPKAS
jgi:hypothetical protein